MAELLVRVIARPRAARALAVVLHGGKVSSEAPTHPWQLAVLRMAPFALALRRVGRADGLAVAVVRFRQRGWNSASGAGAAAQLPGRVRDVRDALTILRDRLGDLPTALVGHSMGARAALLAGGHPQVRAVLGLAPWIEPSDPVTQLADRDVLLMHGDADRITDPRASRAFIERAASAGARASYIRIAGADHAMLRGARLWHRLAAEYASAVLLGSAESRRYGEIARQAASGGARITLRRHRRRVPDPAVRGMIAP